MTPQSDPLAEILRRVDYMNWTSDELAARLRASGVRVSEDAAPTCCELACYEDPGCACDGCRSEDAAPQPDPLFTFERLAAFPTAHPSPADAPAPQSIRDAAQVEGALAYIELVGDPLVKAHVATIRAALDAPALPDPQSLRDALHASADGCDGLDHPSWRPEAGYKCERLARAALDAPALTVEREAVSETVECPACGEVGEAVCVCEHCGHRAPMTRFGRALGEGAGEGVDRG